MTEINSTQAGVNVVLNQYNNFFKMDHADVGRPLSINTQDVYQATTMGSSTTLAQAQAAQRVPPTGGIWSRVRSFLGMAPSQPAAVSQDRGLFSRIRTFLGMAPSPTAASVPVTNVNFGTVTPGAVGSRSQGNLRSLTPAQLAQAGRTDKAAFFKALLPGAIAAERQYGVPASVTLAQAALESGWAKSPIGGYNIFGIKGEGSGGSKRVWTREVFHGVSVPWYDKFALYNNFDDAMSAHGKLFHNGMYKKGVEQFAKDRDPMRFIANIGKTYATDPNYVRSIQKMMTDYNLVSLANSGGAT
ncbi:MAG: glucosaminidase domain-containing protein [Candidatus Sericytochromatia bacterium]|nr:glucosaminidase domain-containing protein [Candidatus Sericytochromatia bacterium]